MLFLLCFLKRAIPYLWNDKSDVLHSKRCMMSAKQRNAFPLKFV
uniref:Uncharacterized protein n=1 Tax=Setaria italica TaxID=4555 RepID=K4ANW9_SETIT